MSKSAPSHAPAPAAAPAAARWLSPARLVALAGWTLGVGLMLAGIAHVAQLQLQRGERFEFDRQAPAAEAAAPYAISGGSTEAADLRSVIDTGGGLQRVGYGR